MALVFAAVLPHSPLLVPNIGKENTSQFKATLKAAATMAEAFKAAAPDVAIVITAHGPQRTEGFAFNLAPRFISNLEIFGDLVTRWEFGGDLILPARVRERLELKAPLGLVTDEGLDYGTAIPLSLLEAPSSLRIAPLSISSLSLAEHFTFGQLLQECIIDDDRRVAIIASADLSHRLNKQSPVGYSPKAKKVDQKIIDCLVAMDSKEFLNLSPALIEETAVEDASVLAVLFGALTDFSSKPQLLSYESPFGVGHAVVAFNLAAE